MNEWGVVLVVIALVGLVAAIARPIVKLNTSITKLTVTLENTSGDVAGLAMKHDADMRKNSDSHARLWDHNTKQDEKLVDHDKRIHTLERKDQDG